MKPERYLLPENDFSISLNETSLPISSSLSRTDQSIICICTRGKALLEVNMVAQTLQKNKLMILFPNQVISQKSFSRDFHLIYISFSNQFINEILFHLPPNFVNFLKENYTHQMTEEEYRFYFNQYFTILKGRYENKEHFCRREIITNLLRNFFLDMYDRIKHDESLISSSKNRKYELMEQFCCYVMSDYKISREVIYYANKLFVTPKYLSRILKELDVNHRSAKEWIDDYTITEIKMTLKYSSQTLQQITNDLNFANASFLCKYFKSRTGITPKGFKRHLDAETTD